MINKSEIARRFVCPYNTVDKYMKNIPKQSTTRSYTSKLDEFKGIIIDKVDNYGANGRGIFNFIKEYKQEEQKKATIRFETSPGL